MFNKRNSVLCIMMILAMVGATGCSCFTSPVKPTSDTSSDKANENKSPETANGSTATPAGREFAGLNWGVGVSFTHDLGSHSRIEGASVVNGFVRVDKERNDIARVMLEAHYFFTQTREFWFNSDVKKNEWGLGPFVAIQPGEKDMIQAIALGVMVGFKRNDKPDDTSSWNIGIGAVVDPSVKVLGDGLEVNAPLPSGEKEARLQEKSQWGVVVLTSFSF